MLDVTTYRPEPPKVSVYWLARMREPGAVLVLDGTAWAAIWRCARGEPVARTWRGPTLLAREAARVGLVEYRGTLRGRWALYTLSPDGDQLHHAWTAERERLRTELNRLRAIVREMEEERARAAASYTVIDDKTRGHARAQLAILDKLREANGETVPRGALIITALNNGSRATSEKSLDVTICMLRKRLAAECPDFEIVTAHGYGYALRKKAGCDVCHSDGGDHKVQGGD